MDNKKIVSSFFFILLSLILVSCQNEPVDKKIKISDFQVDNSGTDLVGTYLMTAYNTSIPTDLDLDGKTSTNQMDETSCFDNSMLILNADHSFTADLKGVQIVFDGVNKSMNCFAVPDVTGTWKLSGNKITLTYLDKSEEITVLGGTLVKALNGTQIVATDASKTPVYLTANATAIYSIQ